MHIFLPQVQSSVDESHHNIEDSFTSLSELLNGLLNERKSELLQQLEKVRIIFNTYLFLNHI